MLDELVLKMARHSRTIIIIGLILVGLIGTLYLVSQIILVDSYNNLEQQSVRRDLTRLLDVLNNDLDQLSSKAGDWANWDDAYKFVQDGNREFVKTNISDVTFQQLNINFIIFLQPSGKLRFAKAFDLENKKEIPLPKDLVQLLSDRRALGVLLQNTSLDSRLMGILPTRGTSLMISARPILTSEGNGPILGTLIFARFLDSAEITKLAEMTHLMLVFQRFDTPQSSDDFRTAAQNLSDASPLYVQHDNENTIYGYARVNDVFGNPALILRVSVPRDIYQQGLATIRFFMLIVVIIVMISAGVAVVLLNHLAVSQRKHLESEERYGAVIEQASEGIFLVDAKSQRVLDTNPAFRQMFGYGPEEIVQLTLNDLTSDPARADEWTGERQFRRRDNTTFDVEASMTRIQKGKNEVICFVIRDITERKRAEEALQESEEKLRLIVNTIPHIVSIWDMNLRCSYMSPSIQRMLGYTPEEAMALTMDQLTTPESMETAMQAYREDLELEQSRNFSGHNVRILELDERHKNGSVIPFENTITFLRDAKGVPVGIIILGTDISERKRAEAALRESEEKYRLIAENSDDVIFTTDADLRFTYISPATWKLRGVGPEEAVKATLPEIMTPESLNAVINEYNRHLPEIEQGLNPTTRLELEQYRKDGSTVWVEVSMRTMRDDEGHLIGFLGVSRDISARKRTEAALRESEENYKFLVENTNDIIWIFNLSTMQYSFGSHSLERILGYTTEEAVGMTLERIFTPENRKAVIENFGKIVAGKDPSDRILMEVEHLAKDGSPVWMEINAVLKRDEQGNPIAFSGATRDITARKKIAVELQMKNTQLAMAMNIAQLGPWEIEVARRCFIFNDQFYALYNTTAEREGGYEMPIDVYLKEFVMHDDAMAIAEEIPRVLAPGSTVGFREIDNRITRRDGEVRNMMTRVVAERDEQGNLVRLYGINQDITERVRAAKALRESERRLADIIDFLPIATMVIDREGRVTAWNRAMEAITGVKREDILGKGDHEYSIPFYGERRPILIDLVYASQEELATRYSHIRHEGGVLAAEAFIPKLGIVLAGYASPLYGSDGSIIGAIESIRDITDIRRVEAELKEAEEKYRTILETMDSGYYEVDLEGNMLFCNPALRKYLGYEEEEVRGLNFGSYMDEEETRRIFKIFNQVYTSGQPSGDFYWKLARQDRQNVYSAASAYPMRNGRGNIVGFRGTVRDITILQEAKDASEAANRSKSAFLANMSHEIRTPMNAILGFAQVMERDPNLSPQSREHLDIINRSGEHLLALINDILEMSKIEAGRATFVPNTFDLHALLKDIERMFHIRTDAKKLRFLLDMTGEVPRWVITDEGKLRQILINLLGNAVKFTEKGGIALRLGTAVGTGNTVNLQFEVEDTGPGMSEDEIDRLFQAFEQTRSGIKSGGTGLGLALSRGFVQVMGGSISVSSTVGKGTTFHFEIPVREGREGEAKPKEIKRRVLHLKPGQDEIRILIADDRDTNRQLLSQLLGPVGFVTLDVVNGEEAVRAVREWKPRVVLMDMTMPVMDGYEATRIIKTSPDMKETAIVAVTASAFEEDRKRIISAGADGYLSKPFKEEELFEIVGRLTGADYVYEDADVHEKEIQAVDDSGEMRRLVAALPADLINRLRGAVESADMDLLNELADEAAVDHPFLAQRTRDMAARYEYDALIELFSQGAS